MNNCPHCGSSLVGEEIPKKDRKLFGGATNFKREIGMEYPEKYDGIWEWMCPDCRGTWPSEVGALNAHFSKDKENSEMKSKFKFSLVELEYMLLTPRQRKNTFNYLDFRVKRLTSLYKREGAGEWEAHEFLFGRLCEAKQIRDFVKHLHAIDGKGKMKKK
jgi:hypothetical protein